MMFYQQPQKMLNITLKHTHSYTHLYNEQLLVFFFRFLFFLPVQAFLALLIINLKCEEIMSSCVVKKKCLRNEMKISR